MEQRIFDGIKYLLDLASQNRFMQDNKWHIDTVNQNGIEPILEEFRREGNFFLVDDAPMGGISMNGAGGFFDSRTYVGHFISRVDSRTRGRQEYERKMEVIRDLFAQFLERIIIDATDLKALHQVYVQTNRIYYREPGKAAYAGAAGLYFQLTIAQPKCLVYRKGNWLS